MNRGAALLLFLGMLAAQTPETGAIRGTVRDTSGAPVAGVSVRCVRPAGNAVTLPGPGAAAVTVRSPGATAATDEDGTFGLVVPAGSCTLFLEQERTTVARKALQVDPGQDVVADFVIPANPRIAGRVLHPGKEPAVDAFVWLVKPGYSGGALKQSIVGPKVTDENGAFTFDSGIEPNRRYYLLVDRPPADDLIAAPSPAPESRQPIEIPTYFPSATKLESAAPLVLQPGERRESLEIQIATAPYYCVAGRIQVSGKPASANFAIQASALAGTRLARLRGDSAADGAFHACGLAPESYRIATAEGAADFSILDSDRDRLDLSAEPAQLTLQVDWEEPPPPPDLSKADPVALSALRKLSGLLGNPTPSDADLQSLIRRLTVSSLPDRELAQALKQINAKDEDFRQMGTLMGAIRSELVNVSLLNLATGAGLPLPGPGTVPFAVSVHGGVPPGDYAVNIQPLGPQETYGKEVSYHDVKLADRVLRVEPGASGTLRILMARDSAALTVKVADPDGNPVPDAAVVLVPASATSVAQLSHDFWHGQTEQDGAYLFRALPPGKYRVLATGEPIRWDAPEDLEKLLLVQFQAKDVELAAKDRQQITLAPLPF